MCDTGNDYRLVCAIYMLYSVNSADVASLSMKGVYRDGRATIAFTTHHTYTYKGLYYRQYIQLASNERQAGTLQCYAQDGSLLLDASPGQSFRLTELLVPKCNKTDV